MEKSKSVAAKRPVAFALAVTIIFILLVLISSFVVSTRWPGDTPGWYLSSTTGRLVSFFVLLVALFRLGWLGPAGLTRLGERNTWLALLLPLAYAAAVSTYAATGNIAFSVSDPALAVPAALFLMAHAFLEEVAFRGMILHAFVSRSGGTNRGLVWSVLVSSLFFGAMHLIYLAAEPLPVVLLRVVFAFLFGIYLGALVLNGRSIYPAAFFHGVLNVAGYFGLAGSGAEETTASWFLMSLSMLPLAVFGIYLLRDVRHRDVLPEAV